MKKRRKSLGKTVVYQWDDQQNEANIIDDQEQYQEERVYFKEMLTAGERLLSKQEKQVFALLSLNYNEIDIATRLNVSRSTVKGYRKRIIEKFNSLGDIQP